MRIAITGANSAVGKALLGQVASHEALSAVAIVRRSAAVADLPSMPNIVPTVTGYDNRAGLTAALDGVGVVVHLAGILFESATTSYAAGNVETTRAVVEAATEAGVSHVVLISSIGAEMEASNGYFRSKGEAEQVVAASGLTTTVIRTPLLLGPDTAGGHALLRVAGQPSVRMLGGGAHSLRPLDVDDLCRAILSCCRLRVDGVTTYELVGPTTVTYRDLVRRTGQLLGHEVSVRSTPIWLAKLAASLAGVFRTGGMTSAVIDVITSDETVRQNADADLGIDLTSLSDTLARLVERAS